MDLTELARQAHDNARAKGFWSASTNVSEKLMLAVSELSEALEVVRSGVKANEVWTRAEDGKPEGFLVELADCIIRCADLAEYVSPGTLGELVRQKHEFNLSRPHLHGRKF